MSEPVHCMPTNDIKEHEESALCWCKPKIAENGMLVLHKVFAEAYGDEREME